jgi:uncharacterized repeat protein (TIGR01451 family)
MKMARLISFLIVLVMTLSIFCLPGVALAQDETPTPADNITMSTQYPKIDAIATGTFQFSVELNYKGTKDRIFDLNATVPQGWDVFITPQYDASKRISSISLKSSYSGISETLQITTTPPSWPLSDPGEYKIKLQAVADNVEGSINLIAKITAKYLLTAAPANQYYNTTVKAGQDNTFSVKVTNTGTATIENITFSSDKPEGWEVSPKPDKIDLLETQNEKAVDFNIKPPPKTVSGDYMITLTVSGKQASAERMSIRVTVETPSVWGWVGVIIIVIVVVGLIVIFMRFGRR